jgi:hypothetical protein
MRIFYIISLALMTFSGPAHAVVGLHTRLTVLAHKQPNGLTLFEYIVENLPDSELPVVFFGLSVDESCHLGAITAPRGWSISYTPEIPWIPWDADDKRDIKPGKHARFSFATNCKLTEQTFKIMGPDPNSLYMRDERYYYSSTGIVEWIAGSPIVKPASK